MAMSDPKKVTGPASYFPSIEKKYGQPIDHWITLVQKQKGMKHMEVVNWLKSEHGMGNGHANAVVAYCFASRE
jgi:hypothetical protein